MKVADISISEEGGLSPYNFSEKSEKLSRCRGQGARHKTLLPETDVGHGSGAACSGCCMFLGVITSQKVS